MDIEGNERGSRVTLPIHLRWSGPREFDLLDPQQLRALYEIVLREGRAADIRQFIKSDDLVRVWQDLVIPDYIRRAWADFFEIVAGIHVAPVANGLGAS